MTRRVTPGWNRPHGYGGYSHGCRCDICREAKREYRRSRQPSADLCQERRACGTSNGYAHGCRGDACGLARLLYQRQLRGTENPKPSKYDTPTPSPVIDLWRSRLYGDRT
jgi:hypothetical protein